MLEGKTREELEEMLINPILQIKRKRTVVEKIKRRLFDNYQIIEGNTQSLINDPKNELPKLDWRVLCLLAEQVAMESKKASINPINFYTEIELKKAAQYAGTLIKKDEITLPLVIPNMIEINNSEYVGKIKVSLLGKMSSALLNYNFDIQREATKVKKGNQTILKPTLIQKNVIEIRNNLKENTQETTQIVINAALGTSDDGDEINYNPETLELTINKGTILDIVDGYHRSKAAELVINEGYDADKEFSLLLLNGTDEEAAKYQGQLAEATPLARTRQRQLASKRKSDEVVKKLMKESKLKGKVSESHIPSLSSGEIVTYDILANAIDEEFNLERRIDEYKATEYLKEFFDMLLEGFEDEFINNPTEVKKESIINESNMFTGYVVLAKRMYENNIEPIKVIEYVEDINFDRNNPMWREIGFLNKDLNLGHVKKMKASIKDFFNKIEL